MRHKQWWLLVILFAIACTSAKSLNLGGDSLVHFKVTADPSSTTIGNALVSNDVEFTKALVVISDIEFRLAANCDDVGETKFEGPYVANLLTQEAVPSLDEVQFDKGKYCKVEFKLDKLDEDELPTGASSEMADLSLKVEGVYQSTIPFVVKLDENEEFEMESEDDAGFTLTPDASNTLFLVFGLNQLFDGIDLGTLDETSGTIYIDKDNNQDAYDIVRDNLKTFSRLQKDSNDDDELDDDDDTVASGILN